MSSSEDEETFQSSSSELENSKTYRIGQIKGDNTTLKELKSKEHYEAIYQLFKNWRQTNSLLTNEKTLLMYFEILGEKYKPTSLWSQYSMLKRTINIHENIDITGYNSILSFLKGKAQGYQCKKSTAFKVHEIENFIANAPDELYLASKVSFSKFQFTYRKSKKKKVTFFLTIKIIYLFSKKKKKIIDNNPKIQF